jgi:hypothetical protein
VLLVERVREITDTLGELLISTVAAINACAGGRVTEEMVASFHRVQRENAARPGDRGQPRESGRLDAGSGVPGRRRGGHAAQLVAEARTASPEFRRNVQAKLHAS